MLPDDLNAELDRRGHRLMFGPRPATHDACTVGGMIGNNSCGVAGPGSGWLMVELVGDDADAADGRARHLLDSLRSGDDERP